MNQRAHETRVAKHFEEGANACLFVCAGKWGRKTRVSAAAEGDREGMRKYKNNKFVIRERSI